MGIKTFKTRDKNAINLKTQYKDLSGVKQFQVYSLIDLYGRGNIFNIITLRYEINKILSPSSNQQQKQIDNYVNIITKYLEPRKRKIQLQEEKIKELVTNIEKKLKPKEPKEKIKTYLIDVMLYTDEEKDKKPDFKKYDRSYWVIGKRDYRQYSITISQNFPSTLIKQRITNKKPDATEWRQIIRIMLTDTEFKTFYIKHLPYINAIYIGAIERLKKRSSSYNPLDENLRDASKVSINYKYIETNVTMNASTFKEAIENKNYIENECWINTIRDFYKDDLLSNKCRKHITRETILNDIGMTEETIKKGISLNTIVAFFKNIIYN